MAEKLFSGVRLSERQQKLIEKYGGVIPGVGKVDLPEEGDIVSEEAIPQVQEVRENTEEEKIRKERIEQINNDLDLALAQVPKEVRSNTNKWHEYKEGQKNAEERLLSRGIDTNKYLKEGISEWSKDTLKEYGERKRILREILTKIRGGESLSEEEAGIADKVGLRIEDLKTKSEEKKKEETVKRDETPKDDERQRETRKEEEKRPASKPSGVEQRIKNIEDYANLVEQRAALTRLRTELMRKGSPQEEIFLVDEALVSLAKREAKRIDEYKDKGEMRPELKEALDNYYTELEKTYDSMVNMVNFYQMSLSEGPLTRALQQIKEIGADGESLSKELETELLDLGILHDLRVMVNSQGSVTEMMLKYAAALKGKEFDRIIHLQNRQKRYANDYVLQCLAKIDQEARNAYRDPSGSKDSVFSLENPRLEDSVLRGMEHARLDFLIARDLYRVTGGEARYGVAGHDHQDEGKGNNWVFEKNGDGNNGSIFRKAMNKRRELSGAIDQTSTGGYVMRYHEELWAHLDPGVSSFWEKLWSEARRAGGDESVFRTESEIQMAADKKAGIPPREYAVLTVEALRTLSLGTERPNKVSISNEIDFNSWMDEIGKVAGTMSKETQYMANPNFKSFQATIGSDYFPVIMRSRIEKGEKKKINREQYLADRLGDLVETLKKSGVAPSAIAKELKEYRNSGFLFTDDESLKSFMKKHGIPSGEKEENKSNSRRFWGGLFGGDKDALKAAGNVIGDIFNRILKGGF